MSDPVKPAEATPAPAAQDPTKPASAAVVKPVPDGLKPAEPAKSAEPTDASKSLLDGPSDEAKDDKKDGNEPAPVVPVVPEKYELKLPEGVTLDQAMLEEATPILKEAKLTNEQANQIAPLVQKVQEKAIQTYVAEQARLQKEAFEKEKSESSQALGSKMQETLVKVAIARDRLFSPETAKLLSQHGNNIHLIRDLAKLGELISEDTLIEGNPSSSGKPITADDMYPSMKKS